MKSIQADAGAVWAALCSLTHVRCWWVWALCQRVDLGCKRTEVSPSNSRWGGTFWPHFDLFCELRVISCSSRSWHAPVHVGRYGSLGLSIFLQPNYWFDPCITLQAETYNITEKKSVVFSLIVWRIVLVTWLHVGCFKNSQRNSSEYSNIFMFTLQTLVEKMLKTTTCYTH